MHNIRLFHFGTIIVHVFYFMIRALDFSKTLFMSLFEKRRARSRVDVLSTAVKNTQSRAAQVTHREAEKSDKKISIDKAAVRVAYIIILMNSNVI